MRTVGKVLSRTAIGYRAGFRFVEDNKIVPVLRFGLFDRFEGPGHFWIGPYEKMLRVISIGIQSIETDIDFVLTSDRIPHRITLNLVFKHNPRFTDAAVQAGLARLPNIDLKGIIKNHADSALRLLIGQQTAEEIVRPSIKIEIQLELYKRLNRLLAWAGIEFLPNEVLLKSIIPPRFHTQSLLNDADMKLLLLLAEQSKDPELLEQMSRIHRRYELSQSKRRTHHSFEMMDDRVERFSKDTNEFEQEMRRRESPQGSLFPRFPN